MLSFFWFNSVGCESNVFWILLAGSLIYMHLQIFLLYLLILLPPMKFSKHDLLPPLFDLLVSILIKYSLFFLGDIKLPVHFIHFYCLSRWLFLNLIVQKEKKNLFSQTLTQYWSVISELTMFFFSTTTGLCTNKCFSPSRKKDQYNELLLSVTYLTTKQLISPLAIDKQKEALILPATLSQLP